MIDLRSDTVTVPTDAMREAMARAPVGDDQFGEDPSINRLQDRMAEMLGKEAALWVPTGTMANQVALRTLTRPGDDVIVSVGSHAVWSETGAAGANAGVQFTELGGSRGYFEPAEMEEAIKPRDHVILPPTTMMAIENTHNRAGGVVVPLEVTRHLCEVAAGAGIASFLDGARLWNASVALGKPISELAAPFDVVWVAFSKALGAPGGSMLAGSTDVITRANRYRRMLGGAMRQVGIFASAAEHAIDHHLDGLVVDHTNALAMGEILAASPAIDLAVEKVETNIVMFGLSTASVDAPTLVARAAEEGVAVFSVGTKVRAVTHRDVTTEECLQAAHVMVAVAES